MTVPHVLAVPDHQRAHEPSELAEIQLVGGLLAIPPRTGPATHFVRSVANSRSNRIAKCRHNRTGASDSQEFQLLRNIRNIRADRSSRNQPFVIRRNSHHRL